MAKSLNISTSALVAEAKQFYKRFFKKGLDQTYGAYEVLYSQAFERFFGHWLAPPRAQMDFIEKNPPKEFYDFLNVAGQLYMDRTEKGYANLKKLVMEGILAEGGS